MRIAVSYNLIYIIRYGINKKVQIIYVEYLNMVECFASIKFRQCIDKQSNYGSNLNCVPCGLL